MSTPLVFSSQNNCTPEASSSSTVADLNTHPSASRSTLPLLCSFSSGFLVLTSLHSPLQIPLRSCSSFAPERSCSGQADLVKRTHHRIHIISLAHRPGTTGDKRGTRDLHRGTCCRPVWQEKLRPRVIVGMLGGCGSVLAGKLILPSRDAGLLVWGWRLGMLGGRGRGNQRASGR